MSKRMTFRSAQAILSVILLTTLTAGCKPPVKRAARKPSAAKPKIVSVTVGVVREQLLQKTVELPATVESDETAQLMARIESYVDKVLVDIGDEVEAGQVLVQLSAPELEQAANASKAMIAQLKAGDQVLLAEREAARLELDVVRAKLRLKQSLCDRRARLVSSGAISLQLLEESEADLQATAATLTKFESQIQIVDAKMAQAESELAVGNAKLEQAKALTGYLEIKAPFAGVIAERNVDPGNLVRPGSSMKPLLVVAKVDKLRAIVHATTDVSGLLTIGQAVEFVADDVPEKVFDGHLSRMAGAFNRKTRMMQAEIDLDNSPDPLTARRPLRAGTYGVANIVLQSAKLPVVPESALRIRGDRTSVIVVRDGACLVTPVTVAFISDEMAAIADGIVAGDQVVVDPKGIKDEQMLKDTEIKITSW